MINANAFAVIEPTDTLTPRNPAKNTTEPSKLMTCVHKYFGRLSRNCIYCHNEMFAGMSLVYSFRNGFVTPHMTAANKISQNIILIKLMNTNVRFKRKEIQIVYIITLTNNGFLFTIHSIQCGENL